MKLKDKNWDGKKVTFIRKYLPNTMLLLLHNMLKAKLQLQKFKEKTKETLISQSLDAPLSVALQGYL